MLAVASAVTCDLVQVTTIERSDSGREEATDIEQIYTAEEVKKVESDSQFRRKGARISFGTEGVDSGLKIDFHSLSHPCLAANSYVELYSSFSSNRNLEILYHVRFNDELITKPGQSPKISTRSRAGDFASATESTFPTRARAEAPSTSTSNSSPTPRRSCKGILCFCR